MSGVLIGSIIGGVFIFAFLIIVIWASRDISSSGLTRAQKKREKEARKKEAKERKAREKEERDLESQRLESEKELMEIEERRRREREAWGEPVVEGVGYPAMVHFDD